MEFRQCSHIISLAGVTDSQKMPREKETELTFSFLVMGSG